MTKPKLKVIRKTVELAKPPEVHDDKPLAGSPEAEKVAQAAKAAEREISQEDHVKIVDRFQRYEAVAVAACSSVPGSIYAYMAECYGRAGLILHRQGDLGGAAQLLRRRDIAAAMAQVSLACKEFRMFNGKFERTVLIEEKDDEESKKYVEKLAADMTEAIKRSGGVS